MSLPKLPSLDDPCGKHFVYRDFVECSESWRSLDLDNIPERPETYAALQRLATLILDPVSERFGPIDLTYGVATRQLIKVIRRDVSPRIDQHSSYEQSATGKIICSRGGAACDFVAKGVDSMVVAQWIVGHTSFDRLYYYGADRPIHVSATDEPIGQCVIIRQEQDSRRVLPTVISNEKFLALRA
jgi:hypothetical protein